MDDQLIEWLRDWLMYFGRESREELWVIGERLVDDAAFRAGFVRAVLVGGGLAVLFIWLNKWYKKCRAFFLPAEAKMSGAKPFDVYQGCLFSAFKIALVGVILFVLLLAMIASG